MTFVEICVILFQKVNLITVWKRGITVNRTHNKPAQYRMLRSVERINDRTVIMYGIEGCCGSERIFLNSLSEDRKRIRALVDNLNKGEFELCLLKDAVNDFLFNAYGVSKG